MPTRNATAEWQGNLKQGRGHMRFGGGAYDGAYSFQSRFAAGPGTNPEELIAAAHAGCFSMALAADLEAAGHKPVSVNTTAKVRIEQIAGKWTICAVDLEAVAEVPGLDQAGLDQIAEGTKTGCPVSRALAGVRIEAKARLK
ncbi:MAG: OsmC family peroxiredoxin [Bauldia sp.]